MAFHFLVINGPNLNLLGKREPHIYGSFSLDEIKALTQQEIVKQDWPVTLDWFQSNDEGTMISTIQTMDSIPYQGLIINPGGYSHTSVSIHDSLLSLSIPVVEVHLSNLYQRESFRSTLVTAHAASSVLMGMGPSVYITAVYSLICSVFKKKDS